MKSNMPLYINHQMEQFSRAYVHAVASAAGFNVFPPSEIDNDSVDLTIGDKGPRGTVRSPRIDLQLKSERAEPPTGDPISYGLKTKNYEELRQTDYMVPRVLVLLFVPEAVASWVAHSEQELALRRCAWWVSLRGAPATKNTTNVTIQIARANTFSVEALRTMLERVGHGGTP